MAKRFRQKGCDHVWVVVGLLAGSPVDIRLRCKECGCDGTPMEFDSDLYKKAREVHYGHRAPFLLGE